MSEVEASYRERFRPAGAVRSFRERVAAGAALSTTFGSTDVSDVRCDCLFVIEADGVDDDGRTDEPTAAVDDFGL